MMAVGLHCNSQDFNTVLDKAVVYEGLIEVNGKCFEHNRSGVFYNWEIVERNNDCLVQRRIVEP